MTVDAQYGGKCSSNMVRYQYLFDGKRVAQRQSRSITVTYASLLSGISSPHSALGFFICSSVTCFSALSLRPSIQP